MTYDRFLSAKRVKVVYAFDVTWNESVGASRGDSAQLSLTL